MFTVCYGIDKFERVVLCSRTVSIRFPEDCVFDRDDRRGRDDTILRSSEFIVARLEDIIAGEGDKGVEQRDTFCIYRKIHHTLPPQH